MVEVLDEKALVQVGDFLVEVGESGFEGLAMVRICGGFQIVRDPDPR
jgi:hypothetical protein